MRKLYLLLDEWNNDKNFVYSELEQIKKYFDVTVICNELPNKDEYKFPENVQFQFYTRKGGLRTAVALAKSIFDPETWKEFSRLKGEKGKLAKISEIVRFYINAELFFDYLKQNKNVTKDSDAIFYSYWYFWKCFAITKHRRDLPKICVVTRTHEYDLFTVSIPSGYQPFKYSMDRDLDKIIFISEHGRDYYIDKYTKRIEEKDSKYLLYHLGTKDYGQNPYVRGSVLNLVSCSSVIPRKRVDSIIGALTQIDKIKINWVHFGDGELIEELRNKARILLRDKNNITYEFKGYTKHEDIMEYYKNNSIDAFVMVAISEGNPVSVMEAMSFGIPIVSCNICNMSNVVKGCGVLIPECDIEGNLPEAIKKIYSEGDEIINNYRNRAREIWENEYQEDKNNYRFLNEVLLRL